jgi:hypothetical protein
MNVYLHCKTPPKIYSNRNFWFINLILLHDPPKIYPHRNFWFFNLMINLTTLVTETALSISQQSDVMAGYEPRDRDINRDDNSHCAEQGDRRAILNFTPGPQG